MNKLVSLVKREFEVAVHNRKKSELTLFPKGEPTEREGELLNAVVELALVRAFRGKPRFPPFDEIESMYFCANAEYSGKHPKYSAQRVVVINPPVGPSVFNPWGKKIVASLVKALAKAKFRVEKE